MKQIINIVVINILICIIFNVVFCKNVISKTRIADHKEDDLAHRDTRGSTGGRRVSDVIEDSEYWNKLAQEELKQQLNITPIIKQAKNIVFFMGDGHGVASFTAARILKGQRTGNGEKEVMVYETFPDSCLIKTYNTDTMVTDSASSSTAYLTGVKTNQENIGVDVNVLHNDCDAMNNQDYWTHSIVEDFIHAGRSTGIVTNTRVTHASPAGAYAHTCNRDWENDDDINDEDGDSDKCDDIAEQLVLGEIASQIKVIMGGGRKKFLPKDVEDPEGEDSGRRDDGKNLIEEWLRINGAKGSAKYMWHRDELLQPDTVDQDYLLGLFDYSHMAYNVDQMISNPSLEEMVKVALQVLQKDDTGYFLFVEGGLIDRAHHLNEHRSAIEEAVEFEKAIALAVNMTNDQDTLIIVTADHSQSLTLNGYTDRGNDIIGLGDVSDTDYKHFTTLMYTNGPGYKGYNSDGSRPDPNLMDHTNPHFSAPSAVPMESANHAGEDVILYARGPHSHLFSGIHENAYIPHALRYASCMGDGLKFCDVGK